MYRSIQKAKKQIIDSHERKRLDHILVMSLKVFHSAVSHMASQMLAEEGMKELQAKLLALDPLRKVFAVSFLFFSPLVLKQYLYCIVDYSTQRPQR